jgi:hypothetical protein
MIENSVTCKKSLCVSAKRPSSDEVNIETYVKEGMKKLGEEFSYVNEYITLSLFVPTNALSSI